MLLDSLTSDLEATSATHRKLTNIDSLKNAMVCIFGRLSVIFAELGLKFCVLILELFLMLINVILKVTQKLNLTTLPINAYHNVFYAYLGYR